MVNVLDTTLRDGSYVVDFQFSKEDTKNITQTLESFEIPYIEIGHGLGLGAYRLNSYSSICTDEEYMSSIRKHDSKIKYGIFFIPGIGDYSDIDLAIKHNIDFIRIGTNINESEKGLEYIKYAKSKGLMVAANFMKSYAVDVDEFVRRASEVSNAGADFVYLVDSAGGMMPDEVQKYIKKAVESCNCEIGFHGHNNLTLAVANSLAAIEAGATIIDSSLQGLGRDGGNASTEVLLSILMQKKLINKKNINALLDYSEVNILPLLKNTGVKAMPLISGLSLFHSGFYTKIKDIA
ncbi:MAG: 4-hydroxy-2-oxovalerate aldolase, partial [Campylobacterales bacterium]|nr:4-hydroxy-2-oxovalerate aldolase [Campylobacterales bacterium]